MTHNKRFLWRWASATVILVIMLFVLDSQSVTQYLFAQSVAEPQLRIQSAVTVTEGDQAVVQIAYERNGVDLAAVIFSLDIDERCLALDEADLDSNGLPDTIKISLPAGMNSAITIDTTDTDGEIDVILADYFPPFVVLPTTATLVELTFDTVCSPPAGGQMVAAVAFSTSPSPSFGDANGQPVVGLTIDGAVTIVSNRPAPTATATATPTLGPPTATPTPTPIPPTALPTATPTLIPTAAPETIIKSFERDDGADGVLLSWSTTQEVKSKNFFIYRLQPGSETTFIPISPAIAARGAGGGSYTYLDTETNGTTLCLFTYLLVEQKNNGILKPYYDFLQVTACGDTLVHRLYLPILMR